jgi:cell division protein FtsB
MFSAIAVVFLLSIVIWNGKQSLVEKNMIYASKKQELSQKIAEQESRSESLEEYKKYVQTKKYVEEIAKEKFGLIYPDELIFKPTTGN